MKKITIIAVALMFSIVNVNAKSFTNSNNILINEKEYQNLLSLGFSDLEIEMMEEKQFEENKNLHGEIVSVDTKYFKTISSDNQVYSTNRLDNNIENKVIEISKEEYDAYNGENEYNISPLANPAIKETNYKKLTTTLVKINNRYRVKNDLHWKTMPSTRSNDINAVRINNSVTEPLSNSQNAYTIYSATNSCTGAGMSNRVNHNDWRFSPSGYGVAVPVPKDQAGPTYSWNTIYGTSYPCIGYKNPATSGSVNSTWNVKGIDNYMYFDLVKLSNASLSVYGSYQHAQTTVSLSNALSFSISSSGLGAVIQLSASISKNYDNMGGTHAQILSPSW